MEKGIGIDELAAMAPLRVHITITDAAKILGGGATRIKALMDLVMTGGFFSWSHSCPHKAPTAFNHREIGLSVELPVLTPDTDPSTVLIPSTAVISRWAREAVWLESLDGEPPPDRLVTARLRRLRDRALELKTGTGPTSPTTPAGRWPWGNHHTKALGQAYCDRTCASPQARAQWVQDVEATAPEQRASLYQHLRACLPPAPRPAPAALPPTPPAPRSWLHLDAAWRRLDALYLAHHWTCTTCKTAGAGRGDRCDTGQRLHDQLAQGDCEKGIFMQSFRICARFNR